MDSWANCGSYVVEKVCSFELAHQRKKCYTNADVMQLLLPLKKIVGNIKSSPWIAGVACSYVSWNIQCALGFWVPLPIDK